jgi:L-seryl-tRNA(Ser) seleniumtransferase
MDKHLEKNRSSIPSVDKLLGSAPCKDLLTQFGRAQVTDSIRIILSEIRDSLNDSSVPDVAPDMQEIAARVQVRLSARHSGKLRAVYNLTGTVLHTNLGRSILPQEAIDAVVATASGASNLEYDLATGNRGDRDSHTEDLLREITGAEAATIVNNNAAAVLLVLNTLALDAEVPVSRGELVEIGGSFRVPDVMSRAGCTLVEIGTTNRTHAKDYSNAITPRTGLLMKVHTSNYQVRGFTKSVADKEVAAIAHENNLPFVTDLGSGTLVDLRSWDLPYEPTVTETLNNDADLVTFSGDKLLGGPQAGIIVGRKDLIERIKSNPLKRALRVDKMTIAALHAVLKLYLDPDSLASKLPSIRLLSRDLDEINKIGNNLLPVLQEIYAGQADVSLVDCSSQIGSGSMPLDLLPSKAIAIKPTQRQGHGEQLKSICHCLRQLPVPVIGRVKNGAVMLDLRCLEDEARFISQLHLLEIE